MMVTELSIAHVVTCGLVLLASHAATSYIPDYRSVPDSAKYGVYSTDKAEPSGLETDIDESNDVTTHNSLDQDQQPDIEPVLTMQRRYSAKDTPDNGEVVFNNGPMNHAKANHVPYYTAAVNNAPVNNAPLNIIPAKPGIGVPVNGGVPVNPGAGVTANPSGGGRMAGYMKSSTRKSRQSDSIADKLGEVNMFDDDEGGFDASFMYTDDDDDDARRERRDVDDMFHAMAGMFAEADDDVDDTPREEEEFDIESSEMFAPQAEEGPDGAGDDVRGRYRRNVYEETDIDPNSGYTPWNTWGQCESKPGFPKGQWRTRICLDKTHCHSGDMEFREC